MVHLSIIPQESGQFSMYFFCPLHQNVSIYSASSSYIIDFIIYFVSNWEESVPNGIRKTNNPIRTRNIQNMLILDSMAVIK